MNNNYGKLVLMLLVSALLGACGDSSSSSSGMSFSGSGAGSGSSTQTYTGKTTPAALTSANAAGFASLVVGRKNIVHSFGDRDASDHGAESFPERDVAVDAGWVQIKQSVADMATLSARAWQTQARVMDATEPCDKGGTLRQNGDINDATLIATVTMTFSNCVTDNGAILNGPVQATLAFSPSDLSLLSYNMVITSLSAQLDGVSYTMSGSEQMNREVAAGKETSVSNLLLRSTVSGAQSMSENMMTVFENGANTLTGKLCLDTEGCVTVSTLRPLITDSASMLEQGELQLMGAAGSRLVLSAADSVDASQPRRVLIGLDANGDGIFETSNLMDSSGAVF